jgi:poly-beta-1,6-N-acetyl-D-glucosamine synthase
MITCSIGICVFNEENNIAYLLESLLAQRSTSVKVREIFVVASGSTDNTTRIVRGYAKRHRKIRLIWQRKRYGKAAAVNLFIEKAKSDILLLVGGDLLLPPNAIHQLVSKFRFSEVGMTGARPVPLNNINDGLAGFAAHLLWDLHHRVSLKSPKMGEVVAFRKIFKRIPVLSSVDEANIEPLIRGQGYRVLYVPEAVIHNRAPGNVPDFIKQRRRIYAGHLAVKYEQSYEVATMHISTIFTSLYYFFRENPKSIYLLFIPVVMVLETYSRVMGWYDYKVAKRRHTIWEEITSTKKLQ